MFVNRKAELKKLNELHASGKYECVIIYGRKRVGKTALIKEFIKDKRAVYFTARADSWNLEHFSHAINAVIAPSEQKSTFEDWNLAFEALDSCSRDERLVVVIDEYPNLAEACKPIASVLPSQIDQRLKKGKIFLIFCGSNMSFMEDHVLGYASPLYGRNTAQFRIRPFSFFEAMPFLAQYNKEDRALLYGAIGGMPGYLARIDKGKTAMDNLKEMFFKTSGFFFDEPENFLNLEFRRPAAYNDVIGAIAVGASKFSEISTNSGSGSDNCSKRLTALKTLGLVREEWPLGEKNPSKTTYRLEDPIFRFWHRFVSPNLDRIELGQSDVLNAEAVLDYMELVFVDICKQFMVLEARRRTLPFAADKVGRWWGSDPINKTSEEIDVVLWKGDSAILCNCKWNNEPMRIEDLDALKKRAKLVRFTNNWLWLFSKSGFDETLASEAAKDSKVRLVSFEEMLP
ncbi:MAG: ATP-binding protein [Clostridiales bacterium]|jgi:AAA+ ATPase superfamily predicted ATPase|nr:ATP-binding protein [Clostridiales bacterium]